MNNLKETLEEMRNVVSDTLLLSSGIEGTDWKNELKDLLVSISVEIRALEREIVNKSFSLKRDSGFEKIYDLLLTTHSLAIDVSEMAIEKAKEGNTKLLQLTLLQAQVASAKDTIVNILKGEQNNEF